MRPAGAEDEDECEKKYGTRHVRNCCVCGQLVRVYATWRRDSKGLLWDMRVNESTPRMHRVHFVLPFVRTGRTLETTWLWWPGERVV